MTPDPNLSLPRPPDIWSRLPGGAVVWVIVTVELVTFAMFFGAFAWSFRDEPDVFRASQALLHPTSAAINTAILLTGSWFVARAANVIHHNRDTQKHRPWLIATALSGVVFSAVKILEYRDIFGHGVNLSTNLFWFFYLFMTVLHLIHVWIGVGICGVVAHKAQRDTPPAETVEAAATYWHLVDLIWLLLFPLLYLSGTP